MKQGCPIAPLLFILGAEILAQNIIHDDEIKGITVPHSINQIKLKQFADDTTFFCKTLIDIREILSRLKLFGSFTGLNINISKCCIMSMGKENNITEKIEGIAYKNQVKLLGSFSTKINQPGK